jgi:hypothetical protein
MSDNHAGQVFIISRKTTGSSSQHADNTTVQFADRQDLKGAGIIMTLPSNRMSSALGQGHHKLKGAGVALGPAAHFTRPVTPLQIMAVLGMGQG